MTTFIADGHPISDTESAYSAIIRVAQRIKNNAPAYVPGMGPGDVVRQGDIYIIRVDDDSGVMGVIATDGLWPSRQLAPGTGRGSRHIVRGDCEVFAPKEDMAVAFLAFLIPETASHRQFIGPLIRARGAIMFAHPDHGVPTLPGPAEYLVTYQRAWSRELRRQED